MRKIFGLCLLNAFLTTQAQACSVTGHADLAYLASAPIVVSGRVTEVSDLEVRTSSGRTIIASSVTLAVRQTYLGDSAHYQTFVIWYPFAYEARGQRSELSAGSRIVVGIMNMNKPELMQQDAMYGRYLWTEMDQAVVSGCGPPAIYTATPQLSDALADIYDGDGPVEDALREWAPVLEIDGVWYWNG